MICNNCGSENPSGTRFCQTCGASLTAEEMVPQFDYEGPQPGNPLTRAIKGVAGSGMFFCATLFFTASIVLLVLAGIYGTANVMETLNKAIQTYENEINSLKVISAADIYKYIDALPQRSIATIIIGQIPAIVYALALWIIFFSGKIKGISTFGISMIKVFKIIKFICVIIVNAAIIGLVAFGTYTLYETPQDDEDLYKYALAFLGVLVLLFIFVILYYAKLIGSLTAAKMAMNGQPGGKFSSYAALILAVDGILTIVGMTATYVTVMNYYGIAAGVLNGLSIFLYALMIGKARRAVYTDLS